MGALRRWRPATYNSRARKVVGIAAHITRSEVATIPSLLEGADAPTRFALQLMSALAGMSGLLAVIGLYGVLSTMVRQRRAQIGTRLALGETSAGIL